MTQSIDQLSPREQAQAICRIAEDLKDKITVAYRARPNKNKPFIVILGEQHNAAAHIAVKIRLLDRLQDNFDSSVMAVGIEGGCGLVETVVREQPPAIRKLVSSTPAHATQIFQLAAASMRSPTAPLTTATFYHAMKDLGLSASLCDMPIIPGTIGEGLEPKIQMSHPLIAKYIPELSHQKVRDLDVSAVGLDGMGLRNYFMSRVGEEHASQVGAKLYIHTCGSMHVTGGTVYPFNESLMGVYAAKGADVLGIMFEHKRLPLHVESTETKMVVPLDGPVFGEGQKEEELVWLKAFMPHVWSSWSSTYLERRKQAAMNDFGLFLHTHRVL